MKARDLLHSLFSIPAIHGSPACSLVEAVEINGVILMVGGIALIAVF